MTTVPHELRRRIQADAYALNRGIAAAAVDKALADLAIRRRDTAHRAAEPPPEIETRCFPGAHVISVCGQPVRTARTR